MSENQEELLPLSIALGIATKRQKMKISRYTLGS